MDSLNESYRKTTYTVSSLSIRIAQLNPILDQFLQCNQKTEWIYITAWNPFSDASLSMQQSNQRNTERNQALLKRLQKRKDWIILPGWGIADACDWPPEASFLVLGAGEEEGRALAKEFKQKAFLYGCNGDTARLLEQGAL